VEPRDLLSYVAYPILAYLVGAIPFGYLLGLAVKGVDVRQLGSGNIGATNVGRILGWPYGVACFVLDALKGYGPVAAASPLLGASDTPVQVAAGLAAILGHLYPVYLRFRGGKGVSTAAGVFAALAPAATALALAVWVVLAAAFRFASLASIAAAAALPAAFVWTDARAFSDRAPVLGFCVLTFLLVLVRHRSNVGRLLAGAEPKIGEGKKP
jgi:glycerol-3-phosphate acyltransferase PlsY